MLYGITPVQQALLDLGGVVPGELNAVLDRPGGWTDTLLLTLFSALFIHTGWGHLVGNMLYLWVFGMPVERRLGGFAMLGVFLVGGAMANLIVALRIPELASPIVGATDKCEVSFKFENKVSRIHEDPRVTKPYSEDQ